MARADLGPSAPEVALVVASNRGVHFHGRPVEGLSVKDLDRAREIAQRDGVTEGLVGVFSVVEPCLAFDVRGNRETCRNEVVRRRLAALQMCVFTSGLG